MSSILEEFRDLVRMAVLASAPMARLKAVSCVSMTYSMDPKVLFKESHERLCYMAVELVAARLDGGRLPEWYQDELRKRDVLVTEVLGKAHELASQGHKSGI